MAQGNKLQAFAAALLLLGLTFGIGASYAEDAYVYSSGLWTPPAGIYAFEISLWGAGGGGAVRNARCVAGGGSGAAILAYAVNTSTWPTDAQWQITIGQGGAPGYPVASDGEPTSVIVISATAGELLRLTAYAGGGGMALSTCTGGGGGGASSSASGSTGGSGSPAGASGSWPAEGETLNGIKAGSSGGGGLAVYGGGNWGSKHTGGAGWSAASCSAAGGAAGFNGDGADGYSGGERRRQYSEFDAAPNSGAGGATSYSCLQSWSAQAGRGGSGGFMAAYVPLPPSPSVTPSQTPSNSPTPSQTPSNSPTPSQTPSNSPTPSPTRTPSATPTRSPTPSITPSPSAQPLSQLVTLMSPITGRQLTAQDDGTLVSLWVNPTIKEKWTAVRLANGKYTFRAWTGRYLTANPGGWAEADATSVGSWEQWSVIINPGSRWTLKSTHNTYLGTTATGTVYLNNNADLYWTKTTV